jgi:ABC-type uncharacterized transport system substrate-binding protein
MRFPHLLLAAVLALAPLFVPFPASAHPHSFVELRMAVVFDQAGLAGFRQRWRLDEMTTRAVMEAAGADFADGLDAREHAAIERMSRENLGGRAFFTDIRHGGRTVRPRELGGFSARLVGAKLEYTLFIPYAVAATAKPQEVLAAVYDPSFYVYVLYAEEGKESGVDPTADPQFARTQAPASPDDYKRFTAAVGATPYTGSVALEGPAERYSFGCVVAPAPEMTYFHGQIVPDAFRLTFSTLRAAP